MDLRFTRRAEQDLSEIGLYTVERWGPSQAAKYLREIEAKCNILRHNPLCGPACPEIRPGLRRLECGRHVIFYRIGTNGVLISRILHGRMLPERHEAE